MIDTPPDTIEEFLRLPLATQSDDPRVVVRRAHPDEFERVYDCVDEAFGRVRPRALFDWMYRGNPFGHARVWMVEEAATGALLKTGAFYPWPIWCGQERLVGSLSGDSATIPAWQRKGLSRVRRIVRRSHPWSGTICTFAGPNENSNAVTRKAGEGDSMLGALTGGIAVLRAGPLLARAGAPSLVATPVGALAGAVSRTWQKVGLRRGSRSTSRFEQVDRFDTAFDPVTARTMAFSGYWSPHNADFLNWRYLDHPVESYAAFALLEDDQPVAYSVLRIDGEEATLAEFAVDAAEDAVSGDRAARLLGETLEVAREAGCAYVNFFSTPAWRHWRFFRRAGLLPYRTKNFLDAAYKLDEAGSQDARNWQLTPGDRDYH